MTNRPGGGLQDLLFAGWELSASPGGHHTPPAGHDAALAANHGSGPLKGTQQAQRHSSHSSRSWGSGSVGQQNAGGIATGSQSRELGSSSAAVTQAPSRKRQRVLSPAASPSSSRRGVNNNNNNNNYGRSEDGEVSTGKSGGGGGEAVAEQEGPENLGQDSSSNDFREVCQYEGCNKPCRKRGGEFCRRHGEGRRCKTPGCTKVDVGGGRCRKHGGGRRCGIEGCVKTDVGGGFCVSHGGGKRCQAEGCANGAQAGGVFCKSHGGGRRCRIEGCMTSAQSGADVLCIKHGGGKRCLVPGCQKLVRKNKRCTKHATAASNAVAPPSQPVSASAAAKATKTMAAVAATTAVLTASTTTVAPVAPAPIPRRRHPALPPPKPQGSSPSLAGPPRPPPPEQRGGGARGRLGWPPNRGASRVGQDQTPSLSPRSLAGAENGDGCAGGRSLPPPVSARTGDPSLTFGGSGGAGPPPLESFPLYRPPVVASPLDGRVAAAGGPPPIPGGSGGTAGEVVLNGVASNANGGAYPPSFQPRFRPLLPGARYASLPSSLSLEPRSSPRETPISTGQQQPASEGGPFQPPPDSSAAANLLSLGSSLTRDLLPGGGGAGPAAASLTGGGRIDIVDDLANRPEEYLASGLPSSAEAPRADRTPPYLGTRISGGMVERASSVSPLPPSLLLQQPTTFATPYVPGIGAPTASTSNGDSSGGTSVQDWSDVGGRPVLSCDGREVIPSNGRSNVSLWVKGEIAPSSTTTTPRARPSATAASVGVSVATPPSPAAVVQDHPGGEVDIARGTMVNNASFPVSGGDPSVSSVPVGAGAAARSLEMVRPTPPTAPQQRSSCCSGGKEKKGAPSGGGRTASLGLTAPLPAAAALAAAGGDVAGSGKARACSTSPPLEQTASFISLSVTGMMCMENCGQTVQRALREVPGVRSVTVHFPTRTASVNIDPTMNVSVGDLTSALDAIGFGSSCIATTTTEEPTLEQDGVNAVWAIASALGLVDRGCAMAWGKPCNCGDDCRCVNCPQHMKKVSHAVDLVLQAVEVSSSADPPNPEQSQPKQQQQQDLGA